MKPSPSLGCERSLDNNQQALKGASTPTAVDGVSGERGARSRLEAANGTWLTPLVRREQEVGLLLEGWAWVKDGLGQVVCLSGEAGKGLRLISRRV
jgi:hypothetical protein